MSDLITKVYLACDNGDLAAVKNFLKTSEFKFSEQLTKETMLMRTIKHENLEVLQFLLEQFKRVKYEECIGTASKCAARMGKLSVIKFIFNKFPDDKRLNEQAISNNIMAPAIRAGHLEIVQHVINKDIYKKYLEQNPEIIEKCFLIAYTKKQFTILNYLITDLNITITPYIERFIETSQDVARLFHLKDLNKALNEELPNTEQNNISHKKLKV
jgi:hypothetical protein